MPETADRTESLFTAAVVLPAEERGAYLERECSGDPVLRDRLLALLGAHDRAGHVIDRPANGDPDQTAGYSSTSEERGTIIAGRYKLLEEIGQGGMGTVWAAEQTTPVRRKVALKLIKAGMDSRSVLARFEAERQALALMDHPNIAKVLDGGLTDSGRPYFVMEYVKGVPITEYCDSTRLRVEERLNLFIQVCSALQHAHQKGIIHRDLKPSNILVAPCDDKPVPKVIDFGLAKAMHQSLTDKTLYTAHEMVLGTPLYMSPEQAQLNNLDVDTRADIYSLGVLLYELLTGTTPIERKRFKEAAWDEIRRMIREEEPPAPSTRLSSTDTLPSLATFRHTEPAKLKKLVRGELDWIVMKALEKDRTRRYETASGFARDIQRYLDDEVVEARPPSPGYRIGKFVRRHRGQVIAASFVLLALLAGIAGTTWGLIREARANAGLAASLARETKANADLSTANAKVQARYDLAVEAVKTFHTGVSEDFLLKEEKFKALRDRLLKSASDFYAKLSGLLGKETDVASRRALAQSNFDLAELTRKVGRPEAALAAHRSVLASREALAAEPEADSGVKAEVGRSLTALAYLLNSAGKTDEALAAYRRSESLLAGLGRSDPTARAALAACRTRMARLLVSAGKPDQALAACKLALADQQALAAVPGASNDARRDLADTVEELGVVLWQAGKLAEAEAEFHSAQAIYQKLADENPAVTELRNSLGAIHTYLGYLLSMRGQFAESEAEHRTALAIDQKLADENPAVTTFRGNLASNHNSIGMLLFMTGKLSEAEAEYRAALAILQKLADENPVDTYFRTVLAGSHSGLGDVLSKAGKFAEVEDDYRTALAIDQKLAAESPAVTDFRSSLAMRHYSLGMFQEQVGKPAEAEAEYRRALAIRQKLADENPADTKLRGILAKSHNTLGMLEQQVGKPAAAEAEYRSALAILRTPSDKQAGSIFLRSAQATSHGLLGLLLLQIGKPSEAEAECRTALAMSERQADDNLAAPYLDDLLAGALNDLGDVARSLGRPAEARGNYERAIALKEPRLREEPADTRHRYALVYSLRRRGLALRDLGDPVGAAADVRRALGLCDVPQPPWPGDLFETACCHSALAGLAGRAGSGVSAAEGQDESAKAMEWLGRAVAMGYRNANGFRIESALDPLRDRPDFKKLMAELEKKSPSQQDKR